MIAAIYSALCLAFAPIAFGAVQVRIAEALTLLCVFSPVAAAGTVLGCLVSNIMGFLLGFDVMCADIFIGTGASLLAAFFSYKLRNRRTRGLPVLSAIPPVVFNAVIIGAELYVLTASHLPVRYLFLIMLYVGIGQSIACFGLGLPLVYFIEKTGIARLFKSMS